jgi:hypothetical protein
MRLYINRTFYSLSNIVKILRRWIDHEYRVSVLSPLVTRSLPSLSQGLDRRLGDNRYIRSMSCIERTDYSCLGQCDGRYVLTKRQTGWKKETRCKHVPQNSMMIYYKLTGILGRKGWICLGITKNYIDFKLSYLCTGYHLVTRYKIIREILHGRNSAR